MRGKGNLAYALLMIITIMIFLTMYDPAALDIADEYIGLLPSIILLTISVYGINHARGPAVIGSFIMLGIGLAIMTGELNTMNILIPDILTPSLTLQKLQALIVVLATILGGGIPPN